MIVEISDERALELADRLGKFIAQKKMSAPALVFIESVRPLNFISSQLLYFVGPFAELIFDRKAYQEFAAMLDKRENIDLLVDAIERWDEDIWLEERKKRKLARKARWKRFKRFLGKLIGKKYTEE